VSILDRLLTNARALTFNPQRSLGEGPVPFTYEISPEDQVAYVTISGPVDLCSTIRMMGELAKDPAFRPDYKVVVDATDMEYSPSLGELRVIAWALGHEKGAFRNKVAVIRGARSQALQHLYKSFTRMAGFALGLFPDKPSAMQWLHQA
jgi:hypothetical protein